jgi:hypothetical protein
MAELQPYILGEHEEYYKICPRCNQMVFTVGALILFGLSRYRLLNLPRDTRATMAIVSAITYPL